MTDIVMVSADRMLKYGNNWLQPMLMIPFIDVVMNPQLEPSYKRSYGSKNEANSC